MEYYYYAKSKVDKWWQSIPPIPQNIGEVPMVAIGAAAITCITLAVVTLTDRSAPEEESAPITSSTSESSLTPSNIGSSISNATSNVLDSIKSVITPAPATASTPTPSTGGKSKQRNRKTRTHQRKKTQPKNKTR
jgi:hypothetical protein